MTRYRVYLTATASHVVEVEADSAADAMDTAEMEHTPGQMCHQCSSQMDLGDWFADEENVEEIK